MQKDFTIMYNNCIEYTKKNFKSINEPLKKSKLDKLNYYL